MRPFLRLLSALVVTATPLAAQSVQPAAFDVYGFRPGATLREVSSAVRELDGGALRCDRSRLDARVAECRATLSMAEMSGPVELWMSAIDSVTGVLTLAGNFAPDEFDALKARLERRFGQVDAQVQGPQWMMQWVKGGRMMRLTWRAQQGVKSTSLSLVDGHVLDGWQAPRRASATPAKAAPAPKKKSAPKTTPPAGVEVEQKGGN
ncbi:MAG TPA: hypothetical protein VFY20_11895 [Gemmatimonadales bacterium]|nr:hypothetical protein [Gemmatimonadales bacterium]